MAKKEKLSKTCKHVDTQCRPKHLVSKTFPQSRHARLKPLKKRKLFKSAIKLKIRHGIKRKHHNSGKTCRKVRTTAISCDGSADMTLGFIDVAQANAFRKKHTKIPGIHKHDGSKLSGLETQSPVSRKVFASNYQQLVQQTMEKSNTSDLGEIISPIFIDGYFENEYQHLVTSALCCKKTDINETKPINTSCESVFSLFKNGFNNTDVTQTPNDKSHIPQYTDVGANKSIAEFSRCGHSGPLFDDSIDEAIDDLGTDTEYFEESCGTEGSLHTQNILPGNVLEASKEVSSITSSLVSFHSGPKNRNVIVLKHPITIFLEGELKVRVLSGSLKVLGHILTSASSEHSVVYSPSGSCKLSLQTVDTGASTDLTNIQSVLMSLGLSSQKVDDIISGLNINGCVALIERASSPLSTYLASHCSIYLYPRNAGSTITRQFYEQEKILQCLFDFEGKVLRKRFTEPNEWNQIANYVAERSLENDCARVMICGGKSVGKSTLLRFLINQSLARVKEVLCLDFDPGQAEFTVPGSVSVVRVSGPLLGPNFTHILQPERMVYIGDVDMSKCPGRYIESAQHIIKYCLEQPEFKKMPWFINTMGFNKGVGVDLTTNLIHLINPTDVVQIQSKFPQRNYPDLLSHEYVLNRRSALQQLLANVHRHLNYTLHIIPSAAEEKHTEVDPEWGLSSKKIRNIMVLAYFYPMLKSPRFSLTDIVPYKISLSQLILGICHETVNYSELLCVMNANLVALCIVPEDECMLQPENSEFSKVLTQPQVAHCLGYGVVRGIDIKEKLLYLITPLPEEQLKDINCLLGGSVSLPASMFMHSSSGLGHIPYVALGSGQATSNRITRRFVPPLKQ